MLDRIITNNSDVLIFLNDSLIINNWNTQAEKTFLLEKSTVIGKHLFEVLPSLKEDYKKVFEDFCRKPKEIDIPKFKIEHIDSNLSKFYKMHCYPDIQEDKLKGACLMLVGNTLTEDEAAEQWSEQIFQVAFEVAHDLREPILTIRLFSELLKKELQDNLFSKEKEFLDHIISGSIRAENFIYEILNGMPGKEYEKSIIDLNEILMIAQDNLQRQILKDEVSLQIDFLDEINGNATLLTQLFQNLISNLIKVRGASKNESINILSSKAENCIIIDIIDRQTILTKEELTNSFRPFFQNEYPMGFGRRAYIGLSIAKKIVDFHGAKCTITSSEKEGTKIELKFDNDNTQR